MLTEQQIRAIFDNLNRLYFNNALPQPRYVEFHFVKKYLGQFHWTGKYRSLDGTINPGAYSILRISTAWDMTDFELEKVIIHEMIHSWQWTVGHCDGHGTWFKHKALEINLKTDYKYKIARLTSLENNRCLKGGYLKKDFEGVMVVYRTAKNYDKKYVAIIPNASLTKIRSWFPKHPNIAYCQFYRAKGEYLNWMKKSVKTVHGYVIPADKWGEIENCMIEKI